MLITKLKFSGGARGVMVIVVGNGHGDTSSNGFSKRRSSKFCEGSRVRQTPKEGRRT